MESEILSQAAMVNETPGADVNNSPGPKAHPQIETAEEEPRRGGKKRSKLACRNCRRRKVRCDVHPHGAPCTNCRLDSVECAPCEKRTRGCIKNKRQTSKQTAIVPSPEQATSSSPADSLGECHQASLNTENDARLASLEEAWFHEHRRSSLSLPSENNPETGVDGAQGLSPAAFLNDKHSSPGNSCPQQLEIPPSYLTCDMSRVSAEDYSYLKQKGSFSLPKRDVLEDLLECYFDYIHPTMPFIDETEFWEIYHGRDADGQPSPLSHRTRISWLIFQAMLFAATTCASPELLRRAGYTSRMVARRGAFFKVRTLYSLDIERDNMVLLQTFLLMSYWRGDAGEDKDAWHWSGLALSKAAGLGLHLQTSTPLTRRQETLRRRCWWSCVLRDRLVALSEQRPPRIQLDEFDVPLLTLADYNVGLRSPICKLSSGEELGKRTTLSMFSVQLIRLMLCSGRNPSSPSMDSQSASPGAAETWGRVSQPTRDDKRFTGFADLDYWMTNLPEVLQHSPRSHGSHGGDAVLPCILVHRSALHIYYHKLILSITMPRLLCPSGEELVRHLQLAQHSSAALAKLHNELVDHDSIHCLHSECFGSSTSSSGLEPLEGQATQMTNPTTFPAVAGTRFTYPLVTEQMTSGPALSDHDFTDSMVIDKWPQNFELTTRNTASSPSVDSILDAGSLFPWPLGDDETYSGMLPADVPDLEADRFSFSTVDTSASSFPTLGGFDSIDFSGAGRKNRGLVQSC